MQPLKDDKGQFQPANRRFKRFDAKMKILTYYIYFFEKRLVIIYFVAIDCETMGDDAPNGAGNGGLGGKLSANIDTDDGPMTPLCLMLRIWKERYAQDFKDHERMQP